MHTESYRDEMAKLQIEYDERLAKFNAAQQSVHLTKSRWAQFLDKLSVAFRR